MLAEHEVKVPRRQVGTEQDGGRRRRSRRRDSPAQPRLCVSHSWGQRLRPRQRESEVAPLCPTLGPHGLYGSCIESCRPECWSGYPFPSTGDFPNPGIEPGYPPSQANSLPSEPPRSPKEINRGHEILLSINQNSKDFDMLPFPTKFSILITFKKVAFCLKNISLSG